MMKLRVQVMETPVGQHLVVTDEHDEMLPNITSVVVKSEPGKVDTVVVTLFLDDELVKIVERK